MILGSKKTTEKDIITICPSCNNVCKGKFIREDNKFFLETQCNEHGSSKSLYFKDADFYNKLPVCRGIYKIAPKSYLIQKNLTEQTISIHINLTFDCNLNCPTCFAKETESRPELSVMSLEEMEKQLKPYLHLKKKPMIVLVGGEPTLRKDLFEIIRSFKSLGFNVRLSTNGIKLVDINFVKKLKDAGLDWVLVQFDSLIPENFKILRGEELLPIKLKVIENLKEVNIKTHIITMLISGINDDESYDLIDYCFSGKNIYCHRFPNICYLCLS